MNCQDNLYRNLHPSLVTRRWFFEQCGVGLGAAALAHLMAESGYAAADPLLPKAPHFAPKAKHVIFLFMAGAPSHLELFDYKPQLAKYDGTLPPRTCSKAIAPHSSIPIRNCSVPGSSSTATAAPIRSCPNCCHSPARSSTILPSSSRW